MIIFSLLPLFELGTVCLSKSLIVEPLFPSVLPTGEEDLITSETGLFSGSEWGTAVRHTDYPLPPRLTQGGPIDTTALFV